MSLWLISCAFAVIFAFSFVVFFGAPYLPTLKPQIQTAFELLDLREGQTVLELGCGDGRVLVAAAQKGLHATGYELNPFLALIAWARTRRYKDRVRVVWGNFFMVAWPPADGVFVFLHTRFMAKLHAKILAERRRGLRVVSFAFPIPGKKEVSQHNGLYLYHY